MNDTDAVKILLAFLPDALPAPKGARAPDGGEVPSRKVACPECHGRESRRLGWRRARNLPELRGVASFQDDVGLWWIPCSHCGGDPTLDVKGRVVGRPGAGFVTVDEYTGREITTAERTAAPAPTQYRRVTCLDCSGWGALANGKRCKTCAGVGHYDVPRYAPDPDPRKRPERASDAMLIAASAGGATVAAGLWDRGSFAALVKSLAELAAWRRFLVWRSYVTTEHPPYLLPPRQAEDLTASLHDVVRRTVQLEGGRVRVPSELRAWAEDGRTRRVNGTGRYANGYARGQRNAEIRQLSGNGWSRRRIAREFGLSKSAVDDIVTRS